MSPLETRMKKHKHIIFQLNKLYITYLKIFFDICPPQMIVLYNACTPHRSISERVLPASLNSIIILSVMIAVLGTEPDNESIFNNIIHREWSNQIC